VNVKPRLHVAPPPADTFGDLAGDLAGDYGLTPDDWQQLVLDDWLSVDEHGLWSSLTCGLSCPRQNGKNGILEIRELFGMLGRGEKILHTAHEVKTARKAFKRLQHFFGRSVNDPGARFPELNARVLELRNVNGQEAIYLDNGGSVEIVARSKNSGRGFTADVLVCDEAQEMSDEDLEALMPTTSAAPLGNPQWIFTGTPPGPKVNGEVFTRTRTDALSDTPYRICWHEWSACDPGGLSEVDLDDRSVWEENNPAMPVGRLLISVVEGERARYSDEGFARERLGVWDDPTARANAGIFPAELWTSAADPTIKPTGAIRYAIDASPDLKSAAIAVSDGHVGAVVEHHPGVFWLPNMLAALVAERPGEVWLDPRGPINALLVDLEELDITWHEVSAQEHAQACGGLLAAVLNGTGFRHPGQPVLDAAVSGATRRPYGDAWAWNRRTATEDISPLVAVTIARWAALQVDANTGGGWMVSLP
jgi:hypothetical protein